jgi:serine/threonine protein kinase/tetratricopeptide (TPR) repeat protein
MVCPHCGGGMAASQSVCGHCGRPPSLTGHEVAVTTLTPPLPDVGVSNETRLAPPTDADSTPGAPRGPADDLTIAPPSSYTPPVSPASGSVGARPESGLQGTHSTPGAASTATLQPGTPFGRRYHIIRSLGAGGMGAVYQAWDEELAVVVAIKVIRPEAMADPAVARDLERRFKRELLLARNVTHKNVVRIHDLGQIDGIKYITMPYVHGEDLASVLKREFKLPIPRALTIARQIGAGLVAAHEAGIVHRDLKPANILLDEEDRALITDFGIARSVSGPGGGTMAGSVVGTLEYMAPEQARGSTADHRADIYAFGLILSDMLIGRGRLDSAENAFAELLERMAKPLPSLQFTDPTIPAALDDLVAGCVHPDPGHRYQTTHELVADLDAFAGPSHAGATSHASTPVPFAATARATARATAQTTAQETVPVQAVSTVAIPTQQQTRSRRGMMAGALALVGVLALAGGAFLLRDRFASRPSPAAIPTRSVSLIILPFRNASGEPSLDWFGPNIASMLRTEVGQSAALRTVPGDRVSQILTDLRITQDSNLRPDTMNRLAQFSSADTVLWGQYVKFGNEVRIDATLQDTKSDRTVALKAQASNEADLPDAIGRLAASVRENLALSPDAIKQLAAASYKPSSKSVQALRYLTEGLDLSRQGKHQEAVKKFEASTQEDTNFALAYSKLAEAYAAVGRPTEAERASLKAVGVSDSLPPQEKYLVLASRARILYDNKKAIEYYENLDKVMPGSDEVQFALATLYKETGAYENARKRFAQLLQRDPKYIEALLGAGQVETWSGNGNEALDYLNRALTIAIQLGNDEARASILRTLGATYGVLNKSADGLRYGQESLDIERRLGRISGIADSLHAIAQMQDDAGQSEAALKNYREALELRRRSGDRQGVGNVLNDLGSYFAARNRYDDALAQFKDALQIQREVRNPVYEAAALNNVGTIYLWLGSYDEAQTYLQQSVAIRERMNLPSDTADTLHSLAEVSVKTGAYETALGQYLKALDLWRKVGNRRAEAIELYNLGDVFEYQGRYRAAVDSKADAVKIFKDIDNRGAWLPKVLASYGSALSQIGQAPEALKVLGEALPLARELKNDELIARILNNHGDAFYYQGDFASARRHYQQADAVATRAKLRSAGLLSRVNLAKVGASDGHSQLSAAALLTLGGEAERLGLRFESVYCSLLAGEAELRLKRYTAARDQLESAMAQSDRLGARSLLAQTHHLLSIVYAAEGNQPDARRHSESARQFLDAIKKDARAEVLQRSDFKVIVEHAN